MRLPLTLHEALAQIAAHCPEVAGAVVATSDGLVLAAHGALQGDTPAACAANLCVQIEESLSLIRETRLQEMLLWCPPGLWHVRRLENGHLLMTFASSAEHAAALRLATQIAGQQMAPMLATRA